MSHDTRSVLTDIDVDLEKNHRLFDELKIRRQHRFLIFKLQDTIIEVESIGSRSQTFSDMKMKLPFSECRYCVYDQDILSVDMRQTSKLWLISWLPLNSTPFSKMNYTTAKKNFAEKFSGVYDIQCSSVADLERSLGLHEEDDDVHDEEFQF